jgi:hypothetical protein
MSDVAIVPSEEIQGRILVLRGQRVLLDQDLARLYGVATKRLLEQVRRNQDRFPQDFCFQLDWQEVANLRSQLATSNEGRGGRRYRPYAFTEHGALMAANVLNMSDTALVSPEQNQSRIHFVRGRRVILDRSDWRHRLADWRCPGMTDAAIVPADSTTYSARPWVPPLSFPPKTS